MPFYTPIRDIKPKKTRLRTLAGLKRLRAQLDGEMPRKTRNATLILGTRNIRNFDDNRFMNGHRTAEDLHYLAEIISRFDAVGVACAPVGRFDDSRTVSLTLGNERMVYWDLQRAPLTSFSKEP